MCEKNAVHLSEWPGLGANTLDDLMNDERRTDMKKIIVFVAVAACMASGAFASGKHHNKVRKGEVAAGIAAGIGFTMAIILMSNIRERLELKPVRRHFKGVPIAFISAGLMALAFMAFDNSLLANLHLA